MGGDNDDDDDDDDDADLCFEGRERGRKEEGTDRRVRTVSLLLYGLSKKVI